MHQNHPNSAFEPGDCVAYGQNGIYRISALRRENLGGLGEKTYYVLDAVFGGNSVIYVPADNPALVSRMRRVVEAGEIDGIIARAENSTLLWIDDEKKRAARFEELIASGNRSEILWVVKVLSIHKQAAARNKKKLRATDEKLLVAAEKAVYEEFAYTLGCDTSEVAPYIIGRLEKIKS